MPDLQEKCAEIAANIRAAGLCDWGPQVGQQCQIYGYPDSGWNGRVGTVTQVLCTGMRIVQFDDWWKVQAGFPAEYCGPKMEADHA